MFEGLDTMKIVCNEGTQPCSVGDGLSAGFYLGFIAFVIWIVRDTILRIWRW